MQHIFTRRRFLALVLPITFLYALYMIFPIFLAGYYSVTNYRGVGAAEFNGLTNYARLFKDRFVGISVKNSLITTVMTLVLALPISFFVAYSVNSGYRRNQAYKSVFFMPYVVPGIISGLIWLFILDPTIGLINNFLRLIGLGVLAQQWIGGVTLTPYSLALVAIWGSIGFDMAVWLMGLKSLSSEVMESAQIDGANKAQELFYITLPMLKETSKSLFVFTVTGSLKIFDTVYQLTGGGPNHMSETIVSYMYNITFKSKLYAYGMSIAVMEFVIAAGITVVFLMLSNKRIDE